MKNFIGILKKGASAKNSLRSLLAVLLLTCGVQNAIALGVCDYPSTSGKVNIDRQITALQSQPVGTVLGSYTYNQRVVLANNCAGQYKKNNVINSSVYSALSDSRTYKSGIEGVGIRVTIDDMPINSGFIDQTFEGDGTSPIYLTNVQVDFIKTGNIVPGNAISGNLVSVRMQDSTGTQNVFDMNIGTVVVKQASCEITGNSAIPVPMGIAKKEDFTGKNSTLKPVNVQIPLQCYADTTVNISFDAASTLGNGIIDLTKGGAEGVGIQLKMSDKVVVFDQKTFVTKTTQEGAFNIPLTAAYIQTADTIKPGIANAVANFTVTYE